MATITCAACNAKISAGATACTVCGQPIESPGVPDPLPIRRVSGKLKAIGTIVLAGGIIATVTGAWWGPALVFPGMVIFLLGRFL